MSEELDRIAVALERIADAIEMTAQKPAWVQSAEKQLGEAQEVRTEGKKKPKPEPKNLLEVELVRVTGGKNKGKIGVVKGINRAWVTLDEGVNAGGEDISVRSGDIQPYRETDDDILDALESKETKPVDEQPTESEQPTEPDNTRLPKAVSLIDFEPSDDPKSPENYVFEDGKHRGKSLYMTSVENIKGMRFIQFCARRSSNDELREKCQEFLIKIGVDLD